MSAHVRELLALDVAGALEPGEAEKVASHLRACEACAADAASWRALTGELRQMPSPRPSRALVAFTQGAAEALVAERAEQRWFHASLGFLIAFAWTVTVVAWLLFDVLTGELALRLHGPLGSPAVWYGVYLLAGSLAAGAAVALLGRRTQREGRMS